MTLFSDVNQSGSENYRPNWQKQHVIPQELFADDDIEILAPIPLAYVERMGYIMPYEQETPHHDAVLQAVS